MSTHSAALSWDDVEAQLFEAVFYAHDPAKVRRAVSLPDEGMLDSLSVVAILDILAEAKPDASEDDLDDLSPRDFRNLDAIRTLYQRL